MSDDENDRENQKRSVESLGRTRKWQLLRARDNDLNSDKRRKTEKAKDVEPPGPGLPPDSTEGELVPPSDDEMSVASGEASQTSGNQSILVDAGTQTTGERIIGSPVFLYNSGYNSRHYSHSDNYDSDDYDSDDYDSDDDLDSDDGEIDDNESGDGENLGANNENNGGNGAEQGENGEIGEDMNLGWEVEGVNEAENFENGDTPIYEGAPITLSESVLSVLTFSNTHNLTGSCLSDLLELISIHCKQPSIFKDTLFKFRNVFKNLKTPITRHPYCGSCLAKLDGEQPVCECNNDKNHTFFIEVPVIEQLRNLFKREGFFENLQYRFNRVKKVEANFEDIYDGELYQKFFQPGGFLSNKNNISFTWYSDGIPVFKSRKYSVYPLYLIINELPYQKRVAQENVITAAFWCGPSDPEVNLYLTPLHTAFDEIFRGISVHTPNSAEAIIVRGLVLAGLGDTPLRSDFCGHVRYNGKFGCLKCLIQGYTIRGDDFGNTHIYPFEGVSKLRTSKMLKKHAEEALQKQEPVFGVKGPTVLSKIMPDVVRGVAIDVMHGAIIAFKKLLSLWFDAKYRNEPFSLYEYLHIVDARLTSIRPPSYVQRGPRSISQELSFFKASELKPLLFYYMPVILQDLMPPRYFNHYMKLVTALNYLCGESVSREQVATASDLLCGHVSQYQSIYDCRFMTSNVHLLLHLSQTVLDLGPLWVTSCFPMEDLNGKIISSVHGTRHVGLQLYSAVAHGAMLPYLVSQLPESKSKKFCNRLLGKTKRQKLTEISGGFSAVGRLVECREISDELRNVLAAAGQNYVKVFCFYRLRHHRLLYYSSDYSRLKSKFSHCTKFKVGNEESFGLIKMFLSLCECNETPCAQNCSKRYFAVVKKRESVRCFTTGTKLAVEEEERSISVESIYQFTSLDWEYVLVPVENLLSLCFFMNVNDNIFVAEPINTIENE